VIRVPAILSPAAQPHRLLLAMLLALAMLLVAGCGGTGNKEPDPTAGWSADRLYRDAKEEIAAGNWAQARTRLQSIESRYPFSVYAQQALIDTAYVNWKDNEPEQAMVTIDRFQQLYPNHPGTDYMLYLKGLVNFTPNSAFLSSVTGQDPSERDPKGLRQSYEAFNELIDRFPNSRYTPDAKLRVAWLVNTIAMNEVHVARYYYERDAYVAAINRAQAVITDFEGVPASEEALDILYNAYDKLGMTDLRDDILRVQQANFPNRSFANEQSGGKDRSWWNPLNWF